MKTLPILLAGAYLAFGLQADARVSITSPSNGSTVGSPMQLTAAISGPFPASMSVYVNNVLFAQYTGVSTIDTTFALNPGAYAIKVTASYSYRRNWSSESTTNVTVASTATSTPSTPTTPVTGTPTTSSTSVAAQIAGDMTGSNEGNPHGVPLSYDWANGPFMSMGNNADGWQAITSWGALYEAAEGNTATNTRVNIREMQTYFLQKSTGKWLLLQNTNAPNGDAYLEDFSGDINKPADVRKEPDGSISATAGGGYNFHFYPADRASINPNDIGGIVVVYQARLILADTSKADDRSSAHYLCTAGADYYPALTGGWPGGTSFNPAVAGGKFKYVKTDWRSFAMSTISQSELASNPPPVDLSGILP